MIHRMWDTLLSVNAKLDRLLQGHQRLDDQVRAMDRKLDEVSWKLDVLLFSSNNVFVGVYIGCHAVTIRKILPPRHWTRVS